MIALASALLRLASPLPCLAWHREKPILQLRPRALRSSGPSLRVLQLLYAECSQAFEPSCATANDTAAISFPSGAEFGAIVRCPNHERSRGRYRRVNEDETTNRMEASQRR
jgi:hypothetical protein